MILEAKSHREKKKNQCYTPLRSLHLVAGICGIYQDLLFRYSKQANKFWELMMLFGFYFIYIYFKDLLYFFTCGQCVSWKASLRIPVHSCPFPTNTWDSAVLSTMADLVLSARRIMYETWALLAGRISWESYLADPSGIFNNCDKKYREKFLKDVMKRTANTDVWDWVSCCWIQLPLFLKGRKNPPSQLGKQQNNSLYVDLICIRKIILIVLQLW